MFRLQKWMAGVRIAALALSAAVALAALPAAAQLSAQDRAVIAEVETYLNRINTLRARFLQVGPAGELSEGWLYLRRPGRMRFEYDPPSPILLVADGLWLVFYDAELEQANRIPLSSSPLSVLVDEQVRLQDKANIASIVQSPGAVRITLADADRPDEGSVTLVFSDQPLRLRQWQVTDAQGLVTRISLAGLETNLKLDPELFVFTDPAGGVLDN